MTMGPDSDSTADWPARGKLPHPERIGPYYVLNLLGEGGMGVVYLAEQREPLRRRVALKLIKHGLDSVQVLARFESERQALAVMNHPGVARILDAGVAEDGRPYFAMEYVAGLPITEFCNRRQLSIRERLKLFMAVCDAIHHAHQKGLIHRDIKPSNVLVTEQDGTPAVKVIDFGVAKATSQQLTLRTLFTERGVLIGTPAYMSPEQAGSTALDVDTRSDIYSLGVLLYELLVGALPHDPQALRRAAAAEMLRIIQEDEPQKPTTRIEKLGETAVSMARERQTDIRTLIRLLRGDLDWITMRALEKNPRRYASASEFAADVERHLAEEPVVAGPPGPAYRIRKLVRRHRAATAAVLAVFVTLVLGIVVSTALFFRATAERERAQLEADALQAALREEPERYRELSKEAIERHRRLVGANSLEFARYLVNHLALFSLLSINPAERKPWEREAMQIIERALDAGDSSAVSVFLLFADYFADSIEGRTSEDETAFERLQSKAFALLRMRGKDADLSDLDLLSDLLERRNSITTGNAEESEIERVAREIVDIRRRALPADSAKLRKGREFLAQILARKASALRSRGESAAAVPVFREALGLLREVGDGVSVDAPALALEIESELGACLSEIEKFDEAETVLEKAYDQLERTQGARSGATQVALSRIIDHYERRRIPEKVAMYRAPTRYRAE